MAQQENRIFVIERDIYARQAIVSYLSWDRRTRVVGKARTPHEMLAAARHDLTLQRLDAVVLDVSPTVSSEDLTGTLNLIQHFMHGVALICLGTIPDRDKALTARKAGARAFFVRERVGIGLAGAVQYALRHEFVVTEDVGQALAAPEVRVSKPVQILPPRRSYPRLTDRIEEALWLCVVEGLPADRAAEEMGVSTSTVRSYIKEGYRILEAEDDTVYPPEVSPAERAFLRYSALDQPLIDAAGLGQSAYALVEHDAPAA